MSTMPTTEKFVGRKLELEQFNTAIEPRNRLVRFFLGPNFNIKPKVFLPYGIGGIGKTRLSRECLKLAENAGWATIEIDWDRANTRPTDEIEMMNIIAEHVKVIYGEKSIEEYLKTQKQIKYIKERVQRLKEENQEKWLAIVDALQGIASGAGGEKGIGLGSVVKGVGELVNISADALAKAEDSFSDWLVSVGRIKADEGMLHKDNKKFLSKKLVKAIAQSTSSQPLVTLFDTCEVLSPSLEEWLRDVIVCSAIEARKPIVFIISGQHNQYRERQADFEDGKFKTIKGYADRLSDPPPTPWDISRFADPEIADYISYHGLEPKQELIDFIQELARGIPYAVQLLTQALVEKGIEYVKENFPPKDPNTFSTDEMVTLVTQRFLRYCLKEEVDLDRVRGLAVLRNWDEGSLTAAWQLDERISPRKILQTLESRYSFILPDRKLHEIVRDFVRQALRTIDEVTARGLGDKLTQHYLPIWNKKTNSLSPLAERVSEPQWRGLTFDTLNALCWYNENIAIEFLTKRVIESMSFDISYAASLIELTNEFQHPPEWFSARSHRLFNILRQIVKGDDREEFQGLEALFNESNGLNLEPEHEAILYLWESENFSRTGNDNEAMQKCVDSENKLTTNGDISLINRLANQFNNIGWKLGLEQGVPKPSENALLCLTHAVELQPENGRLYIGLGVMLRGLGKNEEAVNMITNGIALGEKKGWAYNSLGNTYNNLEQFGEAIAAYKKAIELDSQYALPWNGLGILYSKSEKTDEAVAAFQKAIELDPKFAHPWNGLGNLYSKDDKTDEAVAAFQKAIELDPKFGHPWNGLGNLYSKEGKTDEAVAAYQKAIELNPKHALPWHGLGILYSKEGKTDEAFVAYEKALELDPKDAFLWVGIGNLYLKLTQFDNAIEFYQKAIELRPKDSKLYNDIGLIYESQTKYVKAIESYKQAISYCESDEERAVSWKNIGDSYRKLDGYTEEVTNAYIKACELDNKKGQYRYELGNTYRRLTNFDEAIGEFEQACLLEPNNAGFHYLLALTYAAVQKYDIAIKGLKKVIELDPEHGPAHGTLGFYFRKSGDTTEADRHIQIAHNLMKDEIEYNRACLEAISGNYEEAMDLLKIALEKGQENKAWAQRDPDFDNIRDNPRFKELVYEDESSETN